MFYLPTGDYNPSALIFTPLQLLLGGCRTQTILIFECDLEESPPPVPTQLYKSGNIQYCLNPKGGQNDSPKHVNRAPKRQSFYILLGFPYSRMGNVGEGGRGVFRGRSLLLTV